MSQPAVTRVVEDYLTIIWKAREWPGGEPSTTDLAAQLSVTPSTVSANLKKLARDGFIRYEPYGPIELTAQGRRVALRVVRRHRLVETYLVQRLGLDWDQVHDEADQLEHAVSDVVLRQMDIALGHPSTDPHGDPIPGPDGELAEDRSVALGDLDRGVAARVARVSDRSAEVLRHLKDRGVVPGAAVRVVEASAATGSIRLLVANRAVELSLTAAAAVRVCDTGESTGSLDPDAGSTPPVA